jgi:long-chain acyl-CoA synthetase
MTRSTDIITPEVAGTLPGLFQERVRRSPDRCAYRRFERDDGCCETTTWAEVGRQAARWQAALRREGLKPGERVAVMLRNGLDWVLFDLASQGLGLVVVPLYVNDRPDNFAHIIEETEARFLLIEGVQQWEGIRAVHHRLDGLARIVSVLPVCETNCDPRFVPLDLWLPPDGAYEYEAGDRDRGALASIVYTSGTTGKPKGVMLSHANFLSNAHAGVSRVPVYPDDHFLSFLPLSHTLERTVGYYLPMMAGACVTYVRSLEKLPEDLPSASPTIIVSVPRVFERVYKRIHTLLAEQSPWRRRLLDLTVELGWQRFQHRQGRGPWSLRFLLWPLLAQVVAKRALSAFGGRIRFAISGGAPLDQAVSRFFIALGLPILQGYGLTETGPVVSVNTADDNHPATVGRPIPGVEVNISAQEELLVRGPGVMMGYWRNPAATEAAIDREGWFHTGDQASIDEAGRVTIIGRLKEIIVLANGEKIPPEDIEMAIAGDPLFEQVLVVGDGKPYLSALVVLDRTEWGKLADRLGMDRTRFPPPDDPAVEGALLERIEKRMAGFPGYAQIYRVHTTAGPWKVQEGLVTATLKIRRQQLVARFAREIARLYEGH